MKQYTKTKVIRISETQLKTLQKMKSYNVDVGNFIREAIQEKIKRDYQELILKPKKSECPF
jgi:predicted CopG family antitoxin